jgi:hypothetical protein
MACVLWKRLCGMEVEEESLVTFTCVTLTTVGGLGLESSGAAGRYQ